MTPRTEPDRRRYAVAPSNPWRPLWWWLPTLLVSGRILSRLRHESIPTTSAL